MITSVFKALTFIMLLRVTFYMSRVFSGRQYFLISDKERRFDVKVLAIITKLGHEFASSDFLF